MQLIETKYKKRSNFYDWSLIGLIAFQALGIIGGAAQPIRIIILLLLPFTLLFLHKAKRKYNFSYQARYFVLFFIYAVASVLFAIDQISGFKDIVYLFTNFSCFFVLIFLASKSIDPVRSLIRGWVVFALITIPFAFVEIYLDYHLPVSLFQSDSMLGGVGEVKKFASVTFGNYNTYTLMLLYAFPFITTLLLINKQKWVQYLVWCLILSILFVLITNASRGALIAIGVVLAVFMRFYIKLKIKSNYLFFVALITGVVFVCIKYYDVLFFQLTYRLQGAGFNDNARAEIISQSLVELSKSGLTGVGAGNFQVVMARNYNLDVVAPHNLFLEIAVQYGIFILIGFLVLIYKIWVNVKFKPPHYKYIVYSSLIVFPIASIINSTYVEGVFIWIQLATLYIVANTNFYRPALAQQ